VGASVGVEVGRHVGSEDPSAVGEQPQRADGEHPACNRALHVLREGEQLGAPVVDLEGVVGVRGKTWASREGRHALEGDAGVRVRAGRRDLGEEREWREVVRREATGEASMRASDPTAS
jgi:hypothetical protein